MANLEHVDLLKQGVASWNAWREEHPSVKPDLSEADLYEVNLRRANLVGAYMREANMIRAVLSGASLVGANLYEAILREADLRQADLREADLRRADLSRAILRRTNLSEANLSGADLRWVDLSEAKLSETNLYRVRMWWTTLSNLDLRTVKGLTEIRHFGPSPVALYTVHLPQDGSAFHFLRGTGVPDEWIEDHRARMILPIQYHSLFISYSSKDEMLARRLHNDLQNNGVRCWFAPEDLKIGDKFRQRIDEAIHLQDKLLLLLSEHSVASTWVETEVEAALEKEDRQQREVLFPVRLDDAVMLTSQAWAAMLRRGRHIGDFSNWTNPRAYQMAFKRLLDDLKKTVEQQD